MTLVVAENVSGEKILHIAVDAGAHADDQHFRALGNFGGNFGWYDFHFDANSAGVFILLCEFVNTQCFGTGFADGLHAAKRRVAIWHETDVADYGDVLVGECLDRGYAVSAIKRVGANAHQTVCVA